MVPRVFDGTVRGVHGRIRDVYGSRASLILGFALPAETLCALVTLYHQSQPFITLEKLDKAMDRTFTNVVNVHLGKRRAMAHRLDLSPVRVSVVRESKACKERGGWATVAYVV